MILRGVTRKWRFQEAILVVESLQEWESPTGIRVSVTIFPRTFSGAWRDSRSTTLGNFFFDLSPCKKLNILKHFPAFKSPFETNYFMVLCYYSSSTVARIMFALAVLLVVYEDVQTPKFSSMPRSWRCTKEIPWDEVQRRIKSSLSGLMASVINGLIFELCWLMARQSLLADLCKFNHFPGVKAAFQRRRLIALS